MAVSAHALYSNGMRIQAQSCSCDVVEVQSVLPIADTHPTQGNVPKPAKFLGEAQCQACTHPKALAVPKSVAAVQS